MTTFVLMLGGVAYHMMLLKKKKESPVEQEDENTQVTLLHSSTPLLNQVTYSVCC